jgi:hypothetical protein
MRTISEYLKYITDYRNSLIQFIISELEKLSIKAASNILAEIQLCNTYIDYLTAWDQHYKDRRYNRSDIQTGEQLLKSTAQANKWNDFKMKPSIG